MQSFSPSLTLLRRNIIHDTLDEVYHISFSSILLHYALSSFNHKCFLHTFSCYSKIWALRNGSVFRNIVKSIVYNFGICLQLKKQKRQINYTQCYRVPTSKNTCVGMRELQGKEGAYKFHYIGKCNFLHG